MGEETIMSKRLTRDQLDSLLATRENEVMKLKNEIDSINNNAFYMQTSEYNRGYADGMKRVIEMIEKIMVIERQEQ